MKNDASRVFLKNERVERAAARKGNLEGKNKHLVYFHLLFSKVFLVFRCRLWLWRRVFHFSMGLQAHVSGWYALKGGVHFFLAGVWYDYLLPHNVRRGANARKCTNIIFM